MTAAYQLAKAGVQVTVFEASPFVGGMSRSFALWGQRVDLGPHRFFSSDARVNRLWLEVVGRDYRMVDRLSRILYDGKQFHYPLRAADALAKLGAVEAARCIASYGHARLRPPADLTTFEGWVVSRFGRRLFEIFFQTYSEKLWGIRCDELDADFAAQRIKKLSLFEAVKSAVLGARGNQHKTLVDRFAYPIHGTGSVYERMAEAIRARGSRIQLQTAVQSIEPGSRPSIRTDDGAVHTFDHVISSMPLTVMAARLPAVPERVIAATRALTFRNTILVYLQVDSSRLFDDQWLYIHTPGLRTGRISNFRNWVPELYGTDPSSILSLEYWCDDADPIWAAPDDELARIARQDFAGSGLGGTARVLDSKVVRVPRCYPVYRRGYRDHLAIVIDHLTGIPSVQAIGRYGAFKYNNQDHSILMGILAAENALGTARHDLWAVNTDYEYQEAAVIDETGLVPR
jgi:protoporphyrinogen oxidase